MSTKAKQALENPHEAVAPPEAAARGKSVMQPAHTGEGLNVNPARISGLEHVEGYEAAFAPRALAQVPDIAELSYGKARRIFGTDDRVQINPTNAYPWSAIVSLYIEHPAGNGMGTGFFIGPKIIATCGHCVYIRPRSNPSAANWASRITIMPGRNDSLGAPNNLPFGSIVAPRSALRSVRAWTERGENEFDYGAILLDTEMGSRTGWFGFGAYTDAQLEAMVASLSGYPGDKGGGTQWFHASNITNVDASRVFYRIDMMGGQSGSPLFTASGQGRYACAINAYEVLDPNHPDYPNFGTRINSSVSANLVQWRG